MLKAIVCPVSFHKIDSHTSRLTVFINAVLMIVFLFTLQPVLVYIVTVDYGIRASGFKKFSPLNILSGFIIKSFGLKGKMIDEAPKVFASRLGFICAVLGSVWIAMDIPLASRIVIGFFAVLTILDSVFDVCVGCLIYNHLVYPFFHNKMHDK